MPPGQIAGVCPEPSSKQTRRPLLDRFSRRMQTRVRFAPSPTGTLTVGNALGAVANRRFGDWMLLRIDDTDPARNVPGGEEGIVRDLEWLGVTWDEGPLRTSERADRHREAAAGLPQLFDGVMLWRDDGSPTYHLASVVDDIDFGITHVVRGNDHRPNEQLHRRLHEALGTPAAGVRPPRAPARRGRKEAVEAGRGGDGRVLARGRHPGRGRARLPRGARPAAARCQLRPGADPAPVGRHDRGSSRRGARGARRRAARARPCASRRARPGRGAGDGARDPRAGSPRSWRRRRGRRWSVSGSCASERTARSTTMSRARCCAS